jgi:hypothetical protein
MFRPPPTSQDPPDIFFKHHLRLCVLMMMRGNNPTSQIRAFESWDMDSEDSTEIGDVREDGKDRQRFEARLREQLVNWTPPPDE